MPACTTWAILAKNISAFNVDHFLLNLRFRSQAMRYMYSAINLRLQCSICSRSAMFSISNETHRRVLVLGQDKVKKNNIKSLAFLQHLPYRMKREKSRFSDVCIIVVLKTRDIVGLNHGWGPNRNIYSKPTTYSQDLPNRNLFTRWIFMGSPLLLGIQCILSIGKRKVE